MHIKRLAHLTGAPLGGEGCLGQRFLSASKCNAQISNVFAGKHGFITPRDLFRWAERGAMGYQALAEDGFAVLGERLRQPQECDTVAAVLSKTLNVQVLVPSGSV